MDYLAKRLNGEFARSETGTMTVMGLFLLVAMIMVGGYAVDIGHGVLMRTRLQIATDAAAHAALLTRELESEPTAIAAAYDVSKRNMSPDAFGNVLHDADIVFGDYDPSTRTFTPDPGSRNAVSVTGRLTGDTGNAISTYMLQFVGIEAMDISTTSIFTTYYPSCLREGFVAEDVVDIQSNNIFSNGFCIHSNNHVSLNSNNYFEPGTVVSMPDADDIELPNSGMDSNDGLSEALHEGSWNIRILKRLDALIDGLEYNDPFYAPDYIVSSLPVIFPSRNVDQVDLVPGRIHTYNCSGGASLTIKAGVVVQDAVIVTSCKVKFEQGVIVQNSVIATRSGDAHSMTSAAGLQIGENDNCAEGGGAQLITLGSMDFPADLKMYGGQLLARYDVSFSANADGIEGAAIVAGGEISGTSNMEMGFCGSGMENNFHAEYFKLVY